MARNYAYVEDDPPFLKFEKDTVKDADETRRQGRVVYKPAVMVHVSAHGDTKTSVPYVVEKPGPDGEKVTPWLDQLKERLHHRLISQQYYNYCLQAYEQFQKTGHVEVNGIPVEKWAQLEAHEIKNLKAIQIHSVEQVAEMNETSMQNYGIGARPLKEKAKAYLKASNAGVASEVITNLQAQINTRDEHLKGLEAKIAELQARAQAEDAAPITDSAGPDTKED